MGKEIATQVQETQRIPNRINPRQNTPRHILIKLMKIKHKEQILKAARENQQITQNMNPIRITAVFQYKLFRSERNGRTYLSQEREKLKTKITIPARISFKYEEEIKSFTDKQKLRESSTTKPALQQMLKDLL